jgi:hypothetical protein
MIANPWLLRIDLGGRDRAKAIRELQEVIDHAGGVMSKIAKKLGFCERTAFRLLARAKLSDYALRARRKSGARDRYNGAAG